MILVILAALTAFAICSFLIPPAIRFFQERNIEDTANERKVHTGSKPSMGGIAIFFGFLVSALLFAFTEEQFSQPLLILLALVLVLLSGILDDLVHLSPSYKLAVQIPASLIVIHYAGIRIESFYGFLGIDELPIAISYSLTCFTFIVIINAVNLIDGLDGLAGSIVLVSTTTMGFWFYMADLYYMSVFCAAIAGGIIGFLVYNWEPSKLFMGDTGSLFLGFFVAIGAVHFLQQNALLNHEHYFLHVNNPVTTAICVFSIPLSDTLRVFSLRLKAGKSPFSPDRNHLHHMIMDLGFNHSGTTLILATANLSFIILALSMSNYSDNVTLPLLATTSLLMMSALAYRSKKHHKKKQSRVKVA